MKNHPFLAVKGAAAPPYPIAADFLKVHCCCQCSWRFKHELVMEEKKQENPYHGIFTYIWSILVNLMNNSSLNIPYAEYLG